MAVSISNQVVEDSGVDDIQEARAGVIRGCFLHSIAVALIILPPGGKWHHQGYLLGALLCLALWKHREERVPAKQVYPRHPQLPRRSFLILDRTHGALACGQAQERTK